MLPGASMDRLRRRFRDQFTPTASGYVYRRGSRGPALPVSAEDTAGFVAAFERASRRLSWGGVLGAMFVFGMFEWADIRWPPMLSHYARWIEAVPFLLVCLALFWLAWNAPHRVLNGRAPVAPALTGGQTRRLGLRELPWSVLVLGALVSLGLAVRVLVEPDPLHGGDRLYLPFAAVLLCVLGGIALTKRRAG